MALTENRDLNRYVDQELRTYGVLAGEHIWKGALVGYERQTGYVRNLIEGDVFAGIAYEEGDNSDGGHSATTIRLYTQGDFVLKVNNALRNWIGSPVFAVDNAETTTFALETQSYCGILVDIAGADMGIVRIFPSLACQIEQAIHIPLASLTSASTKNPLLVTQRAIKITSVEVWFDAVPDAGNLDVGIDATDPDEVVNAFNLSSLSPVSPTPLILFNRSVAKDQKIWAKVGQATSTPGEGGMLTMRYFELP